MTVFELFDKLSMLCDFSEMRHGCAGSTDAKTQWWRSTYVARWIGHGSVNLERHVDQSTGKQTTFFTFKKQGRFR